MFEVSIIDNEYAYRAGLLGMYGHLTVTTRKAILSHPQTGHVIQEWYLDTIGFKLLPQNHPDDVNRVVTMITDRNSKCMTNAVTSSQACFRLDRIRHDRHVLSRK